MKQMTLIEMDGFLKGKCIPRDLKVNETNAEYLVRKFAEAEAKISALSEDHQKAIESIKQADVAQAIEKLKRKLVECNRYNYCADAVKGVEYACHAAMLQGSQPVSNHEELPLDYLQGQKDGLEWAAQLAEANHPQTGDWLYDDPLELAKAIRKGPDMPEFDGPTPVTPDGWISCSERMPEETGDIIVVSDGIVMSGISYSRRDGFYIAALEYDDDEPIGGVTHWMPLPEPPQEVK
ncbi:DUF551 domain-containing protein [Escherichia coli]